MSNKTPKCWLCMPEVMGGNETVLEVYIRVQGQHIMGMSGPVDLNFLSVKFMMDMLEIKNQKEVFEKVHNLYQHMLEKRYKEK